MEDNGGVLLCFIPILGESRVINTIIFCGKSATLLSTKEKNVKIEMRKIQDGREVGGMCFEELRKGILEQKGGSDGKSVKQ